jgi:hypothetical protein
MSGTPNLGLPRETKAYAQGSTLNAIVDILDTKGVSVDQGGAGVGWIRFAGQPLADDTVTINGRIYAFDPTGGVYDVAVVIGVAVTNTIDNLLAAINADLNTRCAAFKGAGAVVCMIQSTDVGTNSNFALAESTAGVRMVVSAAAAVGGVANNDVAKLRYGKYIVTAADVAALAIPGEIPIMTFPAITPPTVASVLVVTTAGAFVPLVATIDLIWRQFNAGFWTLCVQDGAATLTAADEINVIVAG